MRTKSVLGLILVVAICVVVSAGIYGFQETKLAKLQAQLNKTTSDLDNANKIVASKDQELVDSRTELLAKDQELADAITEIARYNSQLVSKDQQLASAGSQIAAKVSELVTASTNLQTAQNEKTQMLTQYASLRSQLSARLGVYQQDRQQYITPDDSAVSAIVQEITGGNNGDVDKRWSDYKKMYIWIVNNIPYSSDTYTPILSATLSDQFTWKQDFWRTPAETLKDETGDCEDMALLLQSMLLNYNNKVYAEWTISITSKTPELKGHMAVAFPVKGGNLTIVDPAGKYYTGIENGYLTQDTISNAVNKWLAYWAKDMPGAHVDGISSDTEDQTFTGTQEFITWVSNR